MPGPWKWRRRARGRPLKPRRISLSSRFPRSIVYFPEIGFVNPPVNTEEITIDELEALKLIYLDNLSYDDASKMMNISRGTVWRLVESGRRKLIKAITERRPFQIIPYSSGIEEKES